MNNEKSKEIDSSGTCKVTWLVVILFTASCAVVLYLRISLDDHNVKNQSPTKLLDNNHTLNHVFHQAQVSNSWNLRKIIFGARETSIMPLYCYDSLPLFIAYGSHHKTGHEFSSQIAATIFAQCNLNNNGLSIPSKYDTRSQYFHHFSNWPIYFPNINYFDNDIFLDYENKTNETAHIILLSYTRSPLSTIISGFNYHRQCPERWVTCPMIRDMKNNFKPCVLRQIRWIQKASNETDNGVHVWGDYNYNYNYSYNYNYNYNYSGKVNMSDYHQSTRTRRLYDYTGSTFPLPSYEHYRSSWRRKPHIIVKKVFNCFDRDRDLIKSDLLRDIEKYDLSVCGLYNNKIIINASITDIKDIKDIKEKENQLNYCNIIERLYFEFVRYINCEFDSTYQTHKWIKEYKYGYEFEMEYYTHSSENYDKFVNNLLTNILGFKINQTIDEKDYHQLTQKLIQLDLNRMTHATMANNSHITRVTDVSNQSLDKKSAIEGLLSFKYVNDNGVTINVCEKIKQMTLKLDYQWDYQAYC